ncbi:peptidoglycan-binding protein [Streptosporangium canum]|uniref:peptidoglycan-binding protein n=1 Tax=Streptosporangium canum TaxID=324952 RepID=UPI00369CE724
MLKARGYAKDLDEKLVDPAVYSPKVVAEVKRIQADKGLKKDGEVGKATWPKPVGL